MVARRAFNAERFAQLNTRRSTAQLASPSRNALSRVWPSASPPFSPPEIAPEPTVAPMQCEQREATLVCQQGDEASGSMATTEPENEGELHGAESLPTVASPKRSGVEAELDTRSEVSTGSDTGIGGVSTATDRSNIAAVNDALQDREMQCHDTVVPSQTSATSAQRRRTTRCRKKKTPQEAPGAGGEAQRASADGSAQEAQRQRLVRVEVARKAAYI